MIHQYVNNGYYLVLDVNSGAVHSVDPLIYDAVQVLAERVPDMEKPAPLPEELCAQVKNALSDRYSGQEIGEALADIQELIDQPGQAQTVVARGDFSAGFLLIVPAGKGYADSHNNDRQQDPFNCHLKFLPFFPLPLSIANRR